MALVPDREVLASFEGGYVVKAKPRRLLAVLLDESFRSVERDMHRVVPEIEEERPLASVLDQADGLVGEAVGQILPVRPVCQRRAAVRTEVAVGRLAPLAAADIDVEAVLLRPGPARTQVPLADVPGLEATFAQ